MSDNPATSGFTRGFFGCFGVLGAVVLTGTVLLTLASADGDKRREAAEAAAQAARIERVSPVQLSLRCAETLGQAQARYFDAGAVTLAGSPPELLRDGDHPAFVCHALHAGRPVEIVATIERSDGGDRALVQSARSGGRELRMR